VSRAARAVAGIAIPKNHPLKKTSIQIFMKKCIAYYPIAGSRGAWVRCVHKAEARSRFCRSHGDVVIGVVLGMWASGMLEKAQPSLGFARDKEAAVPQDPASRESKSA
jgi:hypothetical protein